MIFKQLLLLKWSTANIIHLFSVSTLPFKSYVPSLHTENHVYDHHSKQYDDIQQWIVSEEELEVPDGKKESSTVESHQEDSTATSTTTSTATTDQSEYSPSTQLIADSPCGTTTIVFPGFGHDNLCPYTFPNHDHQVDMLVKNLDSGSNLCDDTGLGYRRLQKPRRHHHHYHPNRHHADERLDLILRRIMVPSQSSSSSTFYLVPIMSVIIPRYMPSTNSSHRTGKSLYQQQNNTQTVTMLNELESDNMNDDFRPNTTKHDNHLAIIDNVQTNLTGNWKPVVTTEFLNNLDTFWIESCKAKRQPNQQQQKSGVESTNDARHALPRSQKTSQKTDPMCNASAWSRWMVLRGVSFQRELIRHVNDQTGLELVATNPLATWNRTLVSSLAPLPLPFDGPHDNHHHHQVQEQQQPYTVNHLNDPRTNEPINVVAYWSSNGTVHTSILWYDDHGFATNGNDNIDQENESTERTDAIIDIGAIVPRWETRRYLQENSNEMEASDCSLHQSASPPDIKSSPCNDFLISESILHYYDDPSVERSNWRSIVTTNTHSSSTEQTLPTIKSRTVVWKYARQP